MNRHVNAISGRLSLRPPQRRSLEILDRITGIASPALVFFRAECTKAVDQSILQIDSRVSEAPGKRLNFPLANRVIEPNSAPSMPAEPLGSPRVNLMLNSGGFFHARITFPKRKAA